MTSVIYIFFDIIQEDFILFYSYNIHDERYVIKYMYNIESTLCLLLNYLFYIWIVRSVWQVNWNACQYIDDVTKECSTLKWTTKRKGNNNNNRRPTYVNWIIKYSKAIKETIEYTASCELYIRIKKHKHPENDDLIL